jgi:presenilin-like A22 family membrane protease
MQIPLLLLFILAVIKLFKNNIFITIYSLPIFLVLIYYMLHLPIVAIARYSIILIPTIIIYASSIIVDIVERRGPWGQYICPD